MNARTARWIAWSLVAVYTSLATVGLILQAIAEHAYASHPFPILISMVVLGGTWPVTGALIISRHPRHPVGWLLSLGTIAAAFDMVAAGYVFYDIYVYPGSLPGLPAALVWLRWSAFPFATTAFTLMILTFPTGQLPSPRWKKVVVVAVVTMLLYLPLEGVKPGPVDTLSGIFLDNPLGVSDSVWFVLEPIKWMTYAMLALCSLAATLSLFIRLRRAKGEERQQIKWLFFPAGFYCLTIPVLLFAIEMSNDILLGIGIALAIPAIIGLLIAIAFAIFKYRLYDVDLIINRTLVYGALTAFVVGFYVLIVGGVGLVIQTNTSLAGLLITVILVGSIYRPLHTLLQTGVNLLLHSTRGVVSHESIYPPSEVIENRVEVGEESVAGEAVRVPPPIHWMRVARLAWYPTFAIALWIFLPEFFNSAPGITASFRDNSNPLAWMGKGLPMLAGLVSLFLALLIFSHRSDDRMGLFTSFFLLVYGTVHSGTFEALKPIFPNISRYTEITLPGFVAVLTLIFFAVFPDGRFVPRWTRWVALTAVVTIPFVWVWSSLYSWPPVDFSQPAVLIFTVLIVLLMIVGWISIFYAQVYRYRYISTPQQRLQTKWAVYGMGASFGLQMFLGIPWIYSDILPYDFPFPPWRDLSSMLYSLGIWAPILPVTLTIAVMRYRLYDIDLIINRTLVYGALTAIVVSIYILMVGVVGTFLHAQGNLLITLLATGLIAVLFQPLRERLQRRVNRLIYGERDDPIEALSRLGKQMEAALPSDQVLPALVKTIAQTLKLPFVAITLKGQRDITFGQETENPMAFPFIFQGETSGVLRASPRNLGDKFTPGEMRLLQNLARQAGAAVRNAQLTADLQRSRQTLVTAREEERHRLRRDLHDGIGPTMAGLTLKLDAAKDLVSSGLESGKKEELEEAVQLLNELKTQTQETVQNIRHIVHTLRPPSLDVLGLIPALQAHVGQVAIPDRLRMRMSTSPQDFPRLSAAVEVAAYRIALEAVTNVINHADASECEVSLSLDNGDLKIEIKDNGVGLPKARAHGIGLDSMRERTEELGGRFELVSLPQGTRVCAEIPIAPIRNES